MTAVPDQGGMWGSDATERWERSAFAAVQAYANAPTGLSAWGDRVAANGKAAIGMAETIDTLYHPDLTSTGSPATSRWRLASSTRTSAPG